MSFFPQTAATKSFPSALAPEERRALGRGLALVLAFNALFVAWLLWRPSPPAVYRLVTDAVGFVGPFLALLALRDPPRSAILLEPAGDVSAAPAHAAFPPPGLATR